MRKKVFLFSAIALVGGGAVSLADSAGELRLDMDRPLIGTLQSDPGHAAMMARAGAMGVVVGIGWDRCEPGDGRFDPGYLQSVREKIDAFRAVGKKVVLDLGVQYPPPWLFGLSSSRFVDQWGDPFEAAPGSGECGVNLVFSQEMRERYAAYLGYVFGKLGDDFYAVRLGGGRYGELGYPEERYRRRSNCYWAFDPIAQGRLPGLPQGVGACPVPGWLPGTPSPDHEAARRFLDWYLESLRNYHDWQIATVRRYFPGPLFMLYPSTGGMRPGQLEAAVRGDADGSTGPEKTGEIGRGYDMARYVAGILDSQVVVYSTWLDGFPGADDASPDPERWSPGHYLASLAAAHRPPLPVGGENTGQPDDDANLRLTFQRMRENRLCVLFWAFEPTLFDGKPGHATLDDFRKEASSGSPIPP